MAFSLNDLKSYTGDNETFLKGKNLFLEGKVVDIQVNSFWKTEIAVNGVIDDGMKIRSRISIANDRIVSYGCTCKEFLNKEKACCHVVALAAKYEGYNGSISAGVVYTSGSARRIVDSYMDKTNRYSRNSLEESMSNITICQDITVKKTGDKSVLKASFYLKSGINKYLIKDLYDFTDRINNNIYHEYGKRLGFVHGINAFNEKSREMVEFIVSRKNFEKLNESVNGSYSVKNNTRELTLFGHDIDDFFSILEKNELPVFVDNYKTMYVTRDRLPISVSVREKGSNGYTVKLQGVEKIITGAANLYGVTGNSICICDENFTEAMGDFLVHICNYDNDNSVDISKKDMAPFYNIVMHEVEKYAVVDYDNIKTEELEPWKLNISFNADLEDGDKLTLKTECDYDGVPFDINTGRISSANVNRDYYLEYTVRNILFKYFGELQDRYYETDDYDKIFEFLSEGTRELKNYGSISLSERLSEFKVIPHMPVTASVNINNGLLQMEIDAGDYSRNELEQVLRAYKEKQRYVRLSDKGLMQMEGSELEVISEILADMELTVDDIYNKTFYIPRYRSLYIDKSLKADLNIRYNRNEAFKALVKAIKHAGENEYEIPEVLKGILRGYQETGYYWLKTLDECGFGGILADDMGLGKTIQIISVLESEKECGRPSLIVTPSSLIYNWENEIKKFAPSLTAVSVVGSKSERKDILENADNCNVIITSYELLKRDLELYKNKVFRFHVIDEAQYIKNPTTENAKAVKKIKSETRFALTGTPIENRLAELWSIFDFILPGSLFSYKKFRERYEMPIVSGDKKASEHLKEITKPFIMRRMKKDVLKELPDKLEYEVYAKLEGEQNKLYVANALKLKKELQTTGEYEFNNNKIQIFAELTRLRQICCDPSLCYENYEDESAKLQMCIDLVKNGISGGHKILLFSQFTSMLEIIKKRLEEEGIKYYILTGKTKKESRLNMVENFNIDDTQVFLISLKAGGTGLNLTAADMVIHYDPWWNRAAEIQATDRAHRIGQKNTVSVFRLIAKGTIEEYIMAMQNRKVQLAEDILSGESEGIASLTKDDILRLLG
ncbi:MAG: ATP-dependent helicase [Lachnospiraceae bacterium]|nr:ATP-dependent helicase [Lachnospiraceae bacterium]